MLEKQAPRQDKNYLKFIREQECCVCFVPGSEAHHIKNKFSVEGKGQKGHDIHTIPLCRKHHHEFHHYGISVWEGSYGTQQMFLQITQNKAIQAGVL